MGGTGHYRASVHNPVPPDPSQQPPSYFPPPYTPSDVPPPYGAPAPPPYGAPQPFGAPGPYQQFPGYPPPMPSPGPSGLAIGAFVASICGGPVLGTLLGFGLGIAALVQIRRRPQKGSGFAIAALVISSITLVLTIVVATGAVLSELRNRIDGIETVEATELKAGDCISEIDESTTVYDMPVVPCTQSHKAEVYHVFEFPAGAFPGLKAVEDESDERCGTAFEPYDTEENSDLEIYYLYPEDEVGWKLDRSVQCIAAAPVTPRTTSLVK